MQEFICKRIHVFTCVMYIQFLVGLHICVSDSLAVLVLKNFLTLCNWWAESYTNKIRNVAKLVIQLIICWEGSAQQLYCTLLGYNVSTSACYPFMLSNPHFH